MAANYGSTLPPLTYIHNVLIILHPKRAVLFRPSAAQAMRTSHEACGKGSSASLTGLMVSPFCDGAQLQSPAAAGLLWASSPAFLGLTPLAGGLPRPYSSPECTPQQSGSLLFPVQQLFPPSRSPLPRDLNWADPDLLWDHLKSQDSHHLAPETDLKRRHPGITATMRSILLDWMLEASYCPSLSPPLLDLLLLHICTHRCVKCTGYTERLSTSLWTSMTASWTRSIPYPRKHFKRLESLVYLQLQRLRCVPNTVVVFGM